MSDTVHEMRHVDERKDVQLDDFEKEHFGDDSYDTGEQTEEEEDEHTQPAKPEIVRAVMGIAFAPPQSNVRPPAAQPRFGIRTSAPARKPLNLRI